MKTETGRQVGVPNAVYHADRKCVSSTWLKKIDQTPYHLKCYLDSPPEPSTPALLTGNAVDCLVFEPHLFEKKFIIAPEINKRTNAGKEEWAKLAEKAAKEHKDLISNAMHFDALQTAEATRTNPKMADILKSGSSQDTYIWKDPVTGLLCKCRPDWYDKETGIITDLKTARDAGPHWFSKAIQDFGYHIQAAFYSDGLRACGLPVNGFHFGVIEKATKDAPVHSELMAFYDLDEDDIQDGRDTYTSGLAAINFCMMTGEWHGYTNQVMPISRPPWAKRNNVEMVTSL